MCKLLEDRERVRARTSSERTVFFAFVTWHSLIIGQSVLFRIQSHFQNNFRGETKQLPNQHLQCVPLFRRRCSANVLTTFDWKSHESTNSNFFFAELSRRYKSSTETKRAHPLHAINSPFTTTKFIVLLLLLRPSD
eukprot:c26978_g1_i1.p1 GENE.c26978_g1_i1~~c26978_g1_i1.p1  ORF type:complete len:136 (-),score=10.68 c26978_g1_i1:18-425(-)